MPTNGRNKREKVTNSVNRDKGQKKKPTAPNIRIIKEGDIKPKGD